MNEENLRFFFSKYLLFFLLHELLAVTQFSELDAVHEATSEIESLSRGAWAEEKISKKMKKKEFHFHTIIPSSSPSRGEISSQNTKLS